MPKDMSCAEVFARVQEYLDRELNPDEVEAVKAHLDYCPPCARGFVFEESVFETVRLKLAASACPEDLMARLRECLEACDES